MANEKNRALRYREIAGPAYKMLGSGSQVFGFRFFFLCGVLVLCLAEARTKV